MNLLDTPGHNDFSEDTYRTLAAADTAIMLIDCVQGRGAADHQAVSGLSHARHSIVTFVNKLDRDGKDTIRTSRRDRARARHPVQPGQLAHRLRSLVRGLVDRWTQSLQVFQGVKRQPPGRDAKSRLGRRRAAADSRAK